MDSVLLADWCRANEGMGKRINPGLGAAIKKGDVEKVREEVGKRIKELLEFLHPVATGRKGRATESGLSAKQEKELGSALGKEMKVSGSYPSQERQAEIMRELGIDPAVMGMEG